MKFSIKHVLPYWLLLLGINTVVNFIFDNGLVWSKLLVSAPLLMVSLWMFHIATETDEEYNIKDAFKRMCPYMILGSFACSAGHYYIYKSLTMLNILLYIVVTILLVMLMDRERFK